MSLSDTDALEPCTPATEREHHPRSTQESGQVNGTEEEESDVLKMLQVSPDSASGAARARPTPSRPPPDPDPLERRTSQATRPLERRPLPAVLARDARVPAAPGQAV